MNPTHTAQSAPTRAYKAAPPSICPRMAPSKTLHPEDPAHDRHDLRPFEMKVCAGNVATWNTGLRTVTPRTTWSSWTTTNLSTLLASSSLQMQSVTVPAIGQTASSNPLDCQLRTPKTSQITALKRPRSPKSPPALEHLSLLPSHNAHRS